MIAPFPPSSYGWLEISIHSHPVLHDPLSAFLFDLGCTGIVLEDFEDNTLKAYLPSQKGLEDNRNRIEIFLRHLEKIFPEAHSAKLEFNKIEEQDWSRNWRRSFRSERVTSGLMVVPAWELPPPSFQGHVIRIDPGPAFGTGQHATTRMCLEAMEKASLPKAWDMLDVGTGSGILAIYGAKLGARRVEAIDLDPEALRWARHNIDLNGLTAAVSVSSKPLEEYVDSFSLLVANLILAEIIKLCPHFPRCLNPGGYLILSGLLIEQADEVHKVLGECGFSGGETIIREEWASIVCKKQ
ncbi:MAG: 50S ribosomal protein L11 methyltransferase [Pseudomonadota bacterium]